MDKFVSSLHDKGIQVWTENEKLRFSGDKKVFTNEIINQLYDNREKLEYYFRTDVDNDTAKALSNQMALWIERKMGNRGGHIHNGMVLHISSELDIDNVKAAFIRVMKKHDALTLTFFEKEGVVYGKKNEINDAFFSYYKKSEKEVKTFVENKIIETMDLQNGPLFRVIVCECAKNNYYIGFGAHHIISDAYSLFLIEKDFYIYYFDLLERNNSEDIVSNSYIVTMLDENKYIDSDTYINDLEFWKNNINTSIPGTTLPKFKLNTENRKYKPMTYVQLFSKNDSEIIKIYAKKHQLTPYILLFSIFNIGIHFMNEKKENSIGLFAANRFEEKSFHEVGYYSNGIVYQDKYDESQSFLDYCQEVKEKLIKYFVHQHMPFTELVRKLAPSREYGMPFFNIVFDSLLFPQNDEINKYKNVLCCEEISLIKGSGDYDLIVWPYEKNGHYEFEYRYNGEIYEEYQIRSLASVIEGIIKNINDDDVRLGQIPALYGKNKEIIDDSNNTRIDYAYKNVYEMFCERVRETPDKIAVRYKDQELTYNEVSKIAECVADSLVKKGIHKDSYVGVMMQKSINLIPVIFGIWTAGAVYVPIDPNFPVKRQEYMISNTKISILLKDETNCEISNPIEIIDINNMIQEAKFDNLDKILKPKFEKKDVAYILYTSGSTGKPKGVVISHGALSNFLSDMRKRLFFSKDDIIMATASICFDMSVLEMFLPITTGACVVMVPYEETKSGKCLLKTIQKYDVTFMQATPSSYEMLYDYFYEAELTRPILKTCLCGGESYDLDLVNKLNKISKNIYNAYGPTETTVWSSIYKILPNCEKLKIGKPISNTIIHIVDENKKIVPLGVPGEILIGGSGVFNGYCNAPELTHKAIYKSDGDEVYYCTGDWGYWDQDGDLVFLGRRDSQIKIRGYRIEISEIENVFRGIPAVSNVAVVTVKQNEAYSIVAALTLKNGEIYDKEEIMGYVNQSLPDYMIPSNIILLDEIPRTNNNKIDKKTITEMAQKELLNTISVYSVAETDQEKKVYKLWNEILDSDVKSIDKGFFEVGGNSLLLNKLALRLQREFNKEVDIIELLTYNTIRKMANYMSDNKYEMVLDKEKLNENANRRSSFIRRRKN